MNIYISANNLKLLLTAIKLGEYFDNFKFSELLNLIA